MLVSITHAVSPRKRELHRTGASGHTEHGVMAMSKEETLRKTVDDLRLNPELRLCAKFDALSIADFPVAAHEKMGVRVVDNCAEEHIM